MFKFAHCLTCENGYYLSPSNSCERCVQYCKEYDTNNDNKCTSCIDNYFLFNEQCYQCNKDCKTSIDNCKCVTCEDGYYLENFQCLQCDSSCKKCLDSTNKCIQCNIEYY